jgi:septal ring factor EnvC (AmiA/AmiB activator)
LEENIRIITASDFYDNDRFVSNSDIKFKQLEKETKNFTDEKLMKSQEQDQIRRKIREVEAKTTGDTEKLKSFKDQIAQIENKMFEIEANEKHTK